MHSLAMAFRRSWHLGGMRRFCAVKIKKPKPKTKENKT